MVNDNSNPTSRKSGASSVRRPRRKRKHTISQPLEKEVLDRKEKQSDDSAAASGSKKKSIKSARGVEALKMLKARRSGSMPKSTSSTSDPNKAGRASGAVTQAPTPQEASTDSSAPVGAFKRADDLSGIRRRAPKKNAPAEDTSKPNLKPNHSAETDSGIRLGASGSSFNFLRDDALSKIRARRAIQEKKSDPGSDPEPVSEKEPDAPPEPMSELNLASSATGFSFQRDDALSKIRARKAQEENGDAPAPDAGAGAVVLDGASPDQDTASTGKIVVRNQRWSDAKKEVMKTPDPLQAEIGESGIAFSADALSKSSLRAVIICPRISQIHLAYRVLITLTEGEIDLVTCKNHNDLLKRSDCDTFKYAMIDKAVDDIPKIRAHLKAANPEIKIKMFEDLKGAPGAD